MTLPKWLLKQLEDQGHINAGITRAARIRTCPTCRATTVAGLDADVASLPAICDPRPLTRQGEAIALITGRATYALGNWRNRLELNHRTSFHIRGARQTDVDILATHVCGAPPLPSQPSALKRPTPIAPGSEIPF